MMFRRGRSASSGGRSRLPLSLTCGVASMLLLCLLMSTSLMYEGRERRGRNRFLLGGSMSPGVGGGGRKKARLPLERRRTEEHVDTSISFHHVESSEEREGHGSTTSDGEEHGTRSSQELGHESTAETTSSSKTEGHHDTVASAANAHSSGSGYRYDQSGGNHASSLSGNEIGERVGGGGHHAQSLSDSHGEESEGEGGHSGEEGESEDEEDEEEEDLDPASFSAAVTIIVLLLILLTIGFEKMEHNIKHGSNEHMEPIIESLYGEMTVLGFLSCVTFVLAKSKILEILSYQIFHEEDALLEILEFVHFTLFFVMVFFLVNVLILVKKCYHIHVVWHMMDRACRNETYMAGVRAAAHENKMAVQESVGAGKRGLTTHRTNSAINLLSGKKEDRSTALENQLLFYGLRAEFLRDRQHEPPFAPKDKDKQIPEDFNFGSYLSRCMLSMVPKIVDIHVSAWVFFAGLTILFYVLNVVHQYDLSFLGWMWASLGWIFLAFKVCFHSYLVNIHHSLIGNIFNLSDDAKKSDEDELLEEEVVQQEWGLEEEKKDAIENEQSKLLPKGGKVEEKAEEGMANLPAWCYVDIEQHMKRRTWIAKKILGDHKPERQNTLYWLGRKGPKLHLLILQIQLVFIAVYCALLILAFLPNAIRESKSPHGSALNFGFYLVFSVLPPFLLLFSGRHLMATMVQVGCVGLHRRPHLVADVLREEKMTRAVRVFVTLHQLYRAAETAKPRQRQVKRNHSFISYGRGSTGGFGSSMRRLGGLGGGSRSRLSNSLAKVELNITKGFDFEPMGSIGEGMPSSHNSEQHRETGNSKNLNQSFRWTSTSSLVMEEDQEKDTVDDIFRVFDTDGDGELSLDEFERIAGILGQGGDWDRHDARCRLMRVSSMLDTDGDGTVSREEFRRWYQDTMKKDKLSTEEQAKYLFQLFDLDKNGEITIAEFKNAMDKFNLGFTLEDIGYIIKKLDKDGNGLISEEEFMDLLDCFNPNEIESYYGNGNGLLSEEEFSELLEQFHPTDDKLTSRSPKNWVQNIVSKALAVFG